MPCHHGIQFILIDRLLQLWAMGWWCAQLVFLKCQGIVNANCAWQTKKLRNSSQRKDTGGHIDDHSWHQLRQMRISDKNLKCLHQRIKLMFLCLIFIANRDLVQIKIRSHSWSLIDAITNFFSRKNFHTFYSINEFKFQLATYIQ